jgi:hypothetical protein
MPRQNRVTPFGEIVATPERGTFMGNRGCLHDERGHIRRQWQVRRWLICVLEFKGRKRRVMTPGHYTELFFLDEATALAAGHRPCAECRRDRFNAFRKAWPSVHTEADGSPLPTVDEIDRRLHIERITKDGTKRRFTTTLEELPDGVFVRHAVWGDTAHLVWGDWLIAWTAVGYTGRIARPNHLEVLVLTPESTVKVIRAGYAPDIHTSAIARVSSGEKIRPHDHESNSTGTNPQGV